MAKISPVSIKYMIRANFRAEGALEKPDVIGALFGQTEGLLGSDLELRELQKEGKIGRIEVNLERKNKLTTGIIRIPTALDQSETTLIAAAIETIERIGPCDSQIEVEKIEDIRKSKRDYIVERAKKLMGNIEGSTSSREISNQIRDSKRIDIKEFGKSKLPCGDLSDKEVIVVEGRADVINLMRNGVKNVIAMRGTKLPEEIRELSKDKTITLFVDGDRGGKLIIENVIDNADVDYIAIAVEGKEVEELTNKEIFMRLRKKVPLKEFLGKQQKPETKNSFEKKESVDEGKLKEIAEGIQGSKKAVILDGDLKEIKKISTKTLSRVLQNLKEKPFAVVIDGIMTKNHLKSSEESGVKAIAAKKFTTTDTKINLISF